MVRVGVNIVLTFLEGGLSSETGNVPLLVGLEGNKQSYDFGVLADEWGSWLASFGGNEQSCGFVDWGSCVSW